MDTVPVPFYSLRSDTKHMGVTGILNQNGVSQ